MDDNELLTNYIIADLPNMVYTFVSPNKILTSAGKVILKFTDETITIYNSLSVNFTRYFTEQQLDQIRKEALDYSDNITPAAETTTGNAVLALYEA